MRFKGFWGALFSVLIVHTADSQTIQVGQTLLEEAIRRNDLKDSTAEPGLQMIRPLQLIENGKYDSLVQAITGLSPSKQVSFLNGKGQLKMLSAGIQQQFNAHHSYGWNDGSMVPAKGYQLKATAGIAGRIGIVSFQFQPELIVAGNPAFRGLSPSHTDSTWYYYYGFQNAIDMPERYGDGSITKFFPGQSSIRINYKGMSLGLSSENLWWGPGIRNSLLMSNTAPGFYHVTFNSTRPHKTFLGKFSWQLIAGRLENSGIVPPDTSRQINGQQLYVPKKNSNRYINAMVINWQPKWVKGLQLGFSRSFFQYTDNLTYNFNGILPVFSAFFKGNARDENEFGRDQLLSFYFRWVFAKEQAEIYGEWGRNDHSGNLTDFVLQPEHSRAYLLGIKKIFSIRKNRDLEFYGEITQLETPVTKFVRAVQPWYAHYQIRHGYTHKGQVLGAGIGPGSNSQTLGLNWISNVFDKTGVSVERIVRNNDFYYLAFAGQGDYESHWVDLALTGTKSWLRKRFLYTVNLSLIRSINYQWQDEGNAAGQDPNRSNVNHFQAGFSVNYFF